VKREGVPALTLAKHRLKSELLKNERDILVYTPPGYQESGMPGYPLLILLDGEDPDGLVFATSTIENLIFEKRIPPLVVVRVANPSQAVRAKELACMPEFADFLGKELISFVQKNYNVASNPQKIAIGGYSFGGLAAAYAGLRHSEIFGMVLAQSGAFWWEPTGADDAESNWMVHEFIRVPRLPLRFYMEAGIYEVDLQGSGGGILENSRRLRDVLQAKGYDVTYQEFAGSHDYMNWRGSFANGLLALLGN
jgi:enterochelin esterase family protein